MRKQRAALVPRFVLAAALGVASLSAQGCGGETTETAAPGGSAGTASLQVEWTRQFATTRLEGALSVSVDGPGNFVYVAGYTGAALSGASAGSVGAFVRKYDSSGTEQWTRQFGTEGRDQADSVSIDASGSVYVAGFTYGALSGANAGGADAFVRKYDSTGTEQWTRQFGTAAQDYAYSVSVDASGSVYVAGRTDGALSGANAGDGDAFMRKYDSSGTEQWTRQFGTEGGDGAWSVSADASGNAYVAGWTDGALSGVNAGGGDVFMRKYDRSGTEQWTRQFGTAAVDSAYSVSVNASGSVYVAGWTYGALSGPNAGGIDAFVRKYDSAGTEQWTRQFGGPGSEQAGFVSEDASGSAYVAGWTDGLSGAPAAKGVALVRKYDSAGTEQWTRQFGTAGADIANGVSVDGGGSVYVAGYADDVLANTDGTTTAPGAFLMKWTQ